jgi:hypothetical protein
VSTPMASEEPAEVSPLPSASIAPTATAPATAPPSAETAEPTPSPRPVPRPIPGPVPPRKKRGGSKDFDPSVL